MKTAILAAAASVALWGGAALAQNDSSTSGDDTTVRTPSTSQPSTDSWRDRSVPDQNTGVGGSGPAVVGTNPSAEQTHQLQCNCRDLSTGTGGSGIISTPPAPPPPPAAPAPSDNGYQTLPSNPSTNEGTNDNDNDNDNDHGRIEGQQSVREHGTGGSGDTVVVREGEENHTDLNGVTVLLGGGVEGFTGSLAPRVGVGPTYGASLQFRPTDLLGLELGYSGAVHEIKDNLTHGADVASGADIVRNGARAVGTLGVLDTPVQPYLLAGVGVNWYSVRGNAPAFGFKDDTSGEIPLGAGFRTQVGAFTADLRGLYDIPFSQDFAPGVTTNTTNAQIATIKTQNDGRYQATLSLGANF